MADKDSGQPATVVIRCHYEVLGVERDADAAMIKKAHRKLALKLHPDKNIGDDQDDTHHLFLAVQQAYECLSDAAERKWYDEHRDAILKGWTSGGNSDQVDVLFDVEPYMYAGCYTGYSDGAKGFYSVYSLVFQQVYQGELEGCEASNGSIDHIAVSFGTSKSTWDDVAGFYQGWESFSSALSYAWADQWNLQEAEHRQVRRAMDEDNKRARRTARRSRNDEIAALVRFVKRRDPRVQARKQQIEEEKAARELETKEAAATRKKEKKEAVEQWREQAEKELAAAEEEDRQAGRIRLADLDDDYDYGGGNKKGKKSKKKKKKAWSSDEEEEDEEETKPNSESDNAVDNGASLHDASGDCANEAETVEAKEAVVEDSPIQQAEQDEQVSEEEESEEEEEEPDSWRCECCKKDFKSEGQMENHLKSKKHKVAWKKYEALEQELLEEVMDELNIGDDA